MNSSCSHSDAACFVGARVDVRASGRAWREIVNAPTWLHCSSTPALCISSQPHWRRASSSSADTPSRRDGVSTRSNAGRSHRISTCTWTRRLAGAVAAASITIVGTDTTAGATEGATAGSVAGAGTGAMACVVVGEVAGAVAGEVARAVAAVVSGCILARGARAAGSRGGGGV